MVPRWIKASYYGLLSPLMRLNSLRHRVMPVLIKRIRRAHLGPGQGNYLNGWVNVDGNLVSSRPDIWADLRYELPFPDESIDAIYSHHVIEHLPDLDWHFGEMYRCLRPGGMIRVGGPHGDNAIKAMTDGISDWFGDRPVKRSSLGGRFENFIFCRGEHLTILTGSFLIELAEDAGFVDIHVVDPKQTSFPAIFDTSVMKMESNERPELPRTLLIEARKRVNG